MEMGSDCRPGKEVGDTRMIGWRVGNDEKPMNEWSIFMGGLQCAHVCRGRNA
jgi:hypothetical protein